MDIPKLIGRYEIIERVARGGMGALYRARDPVLEREVAIKVMLADFSHDAIGRARFYREARAVARLQHRNIVTLFDFGEDEGSPFIVMEYLRGQTLGQRRKYGPPVPLEEALSIGSQLCTGLHFAHAHGVIHRDVKPANIWLLEDGGVKLLDFGIAKYGDTDVTQVGDVLGSVSYMSPEQLGGTGIDGRSDIFSAAIVLYELLSGRRPFQGESPTAIMMKIIHDEPTPLDVVPGAPPTLRTLIGRALEKQPEKRFQHAAEFASELRELQTLVERQHDTGSSPSSVKTAETMTATVAEGLPETLPPSGPAFPVSAGPRSPDLAAVPQPAGNGPVSDRAAAADAAAVPDERTRQEHARSTRAAARDAVDAVALHQARPPAGFDLEHYDPAGDMLIGDSGQHHPEIDEPPAHFDAHVPPPSGAARAWLPAGAAIGAIAIALVTFLLVRGEPTEVTSGAVSPVAGGDGRGAASPVVPGGKGDGAAPIAPSSGTRGATSRGTEPGSVNPSGATPGSGRDTPANGSATPGGRDVTRAGTEPSRPGSGSTSTPVKGGPPANTSTPASLSNGVQVILTAAYPFDVMGDAGVISKARTRHELTLANGQALRLRSAEYCFDRRVKVEAKSGAPFKMQMPALGRITVRTPYETCRVSLGGYPLGYPPISERPVASGTYRLTLTCPDGDNQVESVTISPGQTEVALIR